MHFDVFLSYASGDNDTAAGRPGFVSRLKDYIEKDGKGFLGAPIRVWDYETQLGAGVRWEDEMWDQLWLCPIMVPVISPSWMNSRWTLKEWTEKWDQVKDDFRIGTQSCILPIGYQLTQEHYDKLGEAKVRQGEVKVLQLVHKFEWGLSDDEFQKKVKPFLADLSKVLGELRKESRPLLEIYPREQIRGKVFLGMAFTQLMNRWRRGLRQHLRANRYEVVEFNWQAKESAEEIGARADRLLSDCIAAVHFLDIRGGRRSSSEGDGPSPIEVQCIAGDRRAGPRNPFVQLNWTGPKEARDFDDDIEDSRSYWRFVQGRKDSYKTASFDSLKDELLKRLGDLLNVPAGEPPPDGVPRACIIYERQDETAAKAIQEFLVGRRWQVYIPDPSETVLVYSDKRLATFLYYWGRAKGDWCARNFADLATARCTGTPPPGEPSTVGLYLGPKWKPAKDEKLPFRWEYIEMGRCEDFDESKLMPFVLEVESKAGFPPK